MVQREGRAILHDISLTIDAHDFITVIGPNGAGKSMLLQCLMGFYEPDQGRVSRRPSLRIGYVPQRFVVDAVMPVTVNGFLSMRKSATEAARHRVMEEMGVAAVLHQPLHLLSGGTLQRVLLARALLDEPELLVLDEPAQNLDIAGQIALYQLLEQLYEKRRLAIFMVSHDLHLVMSRTRRVICLFHHICCSGEPHVVTQDPEFTSLFGPDMAHMMAVYQHAHNHRHGVEPDAG